VFEWNGPMLHAKTAVTDGRWARVGSTNLNIASWFGNYELDVMGEDEECASVMETMYLDDLTNATEVVLDGRQRIQVPPRPIDRATPQSGGSGGHAGAGLLPIGSTVSAALRAHRRL